MSDRSDKPKQNQLKEVPAKYAPITAEQKLEIREEIKNLLNDPPSKFWQTIESEVETRLQKKVGEYKRLLLFTVGLVGLSFAAVGYVAVHQIYKAGVEQATEKLYAGVYKTTTNAIADIGKQVLIDGNQVKELSRSAETNFNYLTQEGSSRLMALNNKFAGFESEASKNQADLANNTKNFLDRLKEIRATDNVYTIKDLVALLQLEVVTDFTYIQTEQERLAMVTKIRIPIQHEPAGPVSIRIFDVATGRPVIFPRTGAEIGASADGTNLVLTAMMAEFVAQHMQSLNSRVIVRYMIKPR